MSDLIDRQKVIDALIGLIPFAIYDKATEAYSNGLTDAYNLICQLPSAEPEKVLIARINLSEEQVREAVERAKNEIVQVLPSAEPEIIRCKDCKWKQGSECVMFSDVRPFPDDFCSRGERRTDERSD